MGQQELGSECEGQEAQSPQHEWNVLSWTNGKKTMRCMTCPDHYRYEYDKEPL